MPLLGGKGNKFKVDPPKIRIEKVTVERPSPKPKPKSQALAKASSSRSPSAHRSSPKPATPRQKSNSPYPSSSDERRIERKRKAGSTPAPRKSPVAERVTFDKDSDNEDDGWMSLDTRKRQRKSNESGQLVDPNRKLRNVMAYEEPEAGLKFIHAVDVASLESKCVPVMGAQKEDVALEIQYPSPQPRERLVYCQGHHSCAKYRVLMYYSAQVRTRLGQRQNRRCAGEHTNRTTRR